MRKVTIIGIIMMVVLAETLVQAADNKQTPPPMLPIDQWEGPFPETRIVKMVDIEGGVACYLYIPTHVRTSIEGGRLPRGGIATYINDNIGSISCVKIANSNPSAPLPEPPTPKSGTKHQ